ncbi:ATP-NAD kinase family protein [Halosimplex pelagicum]|uniref:ATP-NAD kinase family protein n=1 Tax=Halosimplex pelagicum TaxID=869886 RepID=A0A7D5T6U6_9EURY|nr:ATP-NAD kinase family protein [Halosimplex pelagicum]QLH83568.1 ATP-NAD kinase family protein [Halosimplex pelagicum]
MRRIGVVVNPIAGMGGRVGLKGTDGKVEEARERGAEPRAPERARAALDALAETDASVEILAFEGVMGADAARAAGFDPVVVGGPESRGDASGEIETTAEDTRAAVRAFADRDADLILFAGGDGTAVDVAETLADLDSEIPILGVPAGVKIYSSVFAVRPREAGIVAASFDDVETGEVNDVDEDAYRAQEVSTELRAIAKTPVAEQRQASKQSGGGSVATLAEGVAEEVEPGVTYVLGPGGTVGAIKAELGFEGTPLGVDVWRADADGGADSGGPPSGEVVVRDGGAAEIEAALGERNVVVVSPIGGQGFVFGRGNQQISPAVIRPSTVEIVATRAKLDGLDALRVDTGDPDLDASLRGWHRVRVGRYERRLVDIQ